MELLKSSLDNFFHHCRFEKKLSSKTLSAYLIDLRQFEEFTKSYSNSFLEKIDKIILKQFIQNLHKKFKVRTVKRKLACVKAFFNYIEYDNDNFINPFRKIKVKMKEPFELPTVMNLTEILQTFKNLYFIKNSIKNKSSFFYKSTVRDISIVELFFATGLRVSELTNLKKDNVNLLEGYVVVTGKGNKQRMLQICNNDVIQILQEYKNLFMNHINDNEYFFINRLNKKISDQSIRNTIKKIAIRTNLTKHITPHTYRHTFATMLLEEGVDIKYIQKLLGHSSILTTQIYTHVTSIKQKQILLEKHPRNRLELAV